MWGWYYAWFIDDICDREKSSAEVFTSSGFGHDVSGTVVPCSFLKPGCLQIPSGVRTSANEECMFSDIWEYFIEVTCLILLDNLCGRGKDFTDIFPGQFSAALTGSLSDFLLNSLHASHLLQQMEQGPIRL